MLSFLKTIIKITLIFSICLFCPEGALRTVSAAEKAVGAGKINAYRLNLRARPSRFSKVVIILEKGDVVDVLEKHAKVGGWLKVRYEDYSGYLRNREKYITLIPLEQKKETQRQASLKSYPEKQQKKAIQKREEIKEKIKVEQEKVTTFSADEKRIIEGLNEIDYALNRARVNVLSLTEDIYSLEQKIKKIREEKKELADSIDENTGYTGQRLDALYRLNMIGRLEIAGTPKSVFDFFLKQNAMKRIIRSDFDLIEQQTHDMKEMAALTQKLEEQHRVKTDLENELSFQIRIKEKESRKKAVILEDIRKKKHLALAAVASLEEAAADLDQRIEQFDDISSVQTQGQQFTSFKGKLKFPVKGKIISRFGPSRSNDYGSFTFQSGIDIRTDRGEPVKCVFDGEVLFAEWLKGYGNVMIINHGENYYSLYAHVEEVFKKTGEKVQTGEVIATAGDTGSIKGLCLHFELRHHGKPINPLKWLKKGA